VVFGVTAATKQQQHYVGKHGLPVPVLSSVAKACVTGLFMHTYAMFAWRDDGPKLTPALPVTPRSLSD
jgi:hypothetical protein